MKKVGVVSNKSEKGSVHTGTIGGKVEQVRKSVQQDENTELKKLLKEHEAVYNPYQDLWRRSPEAEVNSADECVISPASSQNQSENAISNREQVPLENSAVRSEPDLSPNVHVASMNKGRRNPSWSAQTGPRIAGDSLPIRQPAASTLFNKQPLKARAARDSLYIRQPAVPRFRKPHENQVKFVPKVYFQPKGQSVPKVNELQEKETPRSLRVNTSEVGSKLVANLTSAWYWSGYYAGYNARLTEE